MHKKNNSSLPSLGKKQYDNSSISLNNNNETGFQDEYTNSQTLRNGNQGSLFNETSLMSQENNKQAYQINNSTSRNKKFKLLEMRKEIYSHDYSIEASNIMNHAKSTLSTNKHQFLNQSQMSWLMEEKHSDQTAEKEEEENFRIIKKLQDPNGSFEYKPEDKNPKSLVGKGAVQHFYTGYKKINKVLQENVYFDIIPSAQTAMISLSERKSVIPCKIGLVKDKGEDDLLKIKNMKYGDRYADVLSSGLSKQSKVKNFILSGNRISDGGADNLLKTISRKAKHLDLSNNRIGQVGCEHISMAIPLRDCKIEVLNLEDNKLGDTSIIMIVNSISAQSGKTLRKLNISKNYLAEKSAQPICQMIQDSQLEELYMHWNQFKAPQGQLFFTTLTEFDSLRVLDLSCNALGSGGDCSNQIGEYIKKTTYMQHLDLSNNYFDLPQSTNISQALEKNNSMYGFHFAGNVGYIDNRMFLVIDSGKDKLPPPLTGMNVKRRIDGIKPSTQQIVKNQRDEEMYDCCWICEGWNEHQFVYKTDISGPPIQDPTFIRFNFENFRPNYHGKLDGGTVPELVYNRMLPPGELIYFYTVGETFNTHALDHVHRENPNSVTLEIPNEIPPENFDNQPVSDRQSVNEITGSMVAIEPVQPIEVPKQYKLCKGLEDVPSYEDKLVSIELAKYNTLLIKKNEHILSELYEPNVQVKPRIRDPIYIPAKKKKQKPKWTFPISLMYPWKPDDEKKLVKCFEFDWEFSKVPKFVKDEDQCKEVKEFLRSKYKHIKDTYKYYASKQPVGDVWAMTVPQFWAWMDDLKFIEPKVPEPEVNLKFTTVYSNSMKTARDPTNCIVRYQMLEMIGRLAGQKYIENYKVTTNWFDAITRFWNEHLEKTMTVHDQQPWREERYWNEHVDYCFKNYKKIVENIYKNYSKKKVKPGQAAFMCLDELTSIIAQAGLLELENIGPEVALNAFNLSMMTQIDELNSDRIFQMSFVEFLEALGRIAEVASDGPHKTLYVELGLDEDPNLEKRKKFLLGWKLEGLMMRLLDNVCDNSFKAQYPKIEKSFFCRPDDWEDYE